MVLGVIDVRGSILPVLSMRKCLRMPERMISPAEQFLIARTERRTVALLVDEALEVIEHPDGDVTSVDQIVSGLEAIHGMIRLRDGLVLICDLEQFLSPDEERALDAALLTEADHAR